MRGSTDPGPDADRPAGYCLLHTSDTHLGHQQYSKVDPDAGLNQRMVDHERAWRATIDHALETKPDVFLHAGDLFDGVRPSNRALYGAMEGLLKLSAAGVETVLIAGNHEHPKMRETGSPFRLFGHLPHVHPVYKGRHEAIQVVEGLTVHAVPQCPDAQTLRDQVQGIEPAPGRNVLMLHGSVREMEAFCNAEFNEQTLDPAWFDDRFDYVALGHFHGVAEVTPRAWYCGAPDRVSIAEAGEEKGFLEVHLDRADDVDGGLGVDFHPLPIRAYLDLPILHARRLDADGVLAAAQEALARVPDGAVTRLTIDGLDPSLRGTLDQRAIRKAADHVLHLELRLGWQDQDRDVRGAAEFGGLVEEFEAFAAHQSIERLERKRLVDMGRTVLEEAG